MDFNDQNDYDMGMEEENNEIDEDNNELNENNNDNYNEMDDDENNDNFNQNFNNNDYFQAENNFNNNSNNQLFQNNDMNNDFQNFDENDLYALNMDNIQLKNKNQKLQQLLSMKNKEINNLKLNFSNQMQIMNQKLSQYKVMANNYSNIQNELNLTKQKYLKEIKNKNNIIYNLQKGVNINDNNNILIDNDENSEFLFNITQQIKSIQQDILEEPDTDIISQEDYQKLDKEQQIQFLLNDLNELSHKLTGYKNNNMKEIVRLRNIIDSNESNQKQINEKFYLDVINLMKKMKQNNIGEIKLPEYSLNDSHEIWKNNIINTIKILIEFIINKKTNNNKKDDELIKRLKEMSELLSKNSQNLISANNEINELKIKNNKLNEEYNTLFNKSEQDKKKLMNDLNKKNQQIKSLEHINTRLSNQLNDTKNNDNKKPVAKYGKINKGKNKEKNSDKLNLKNNQFNKDENSEKNLEIFLNKFTDGEYGNFLKNNNGIDNENIDIENLKDEIDKFNKKINKDLELEEKK